MSFGQFFLECSARPRARRQDGPPAGRSQLQSPQMRPSQPQLNTLAAAAPAPARASPKGGLAMAMGADTGYFSPPARSTGRAQPLQVLRANQPQQLPTLLLGGSAQTPTGNSERG